MSEHDIYHSPFSWRYGSDAMRQLFSERHRRRLWRRVWVALARAQTRAGLIAPQQLVDIETHAGDIDLERSLAVESVIRHDVMAEIQVFAEQCPVGGSVIHLGATSMDIVDNAEILRQQEALDLILERVKSVMEVFIELVERYADTPVMGYTHIQPAEPTTLGYRFAQTLQDLLADWEELHRIRANLRAKGFKGATGTMASYRQLLMETTITPAELEAWALAELDLKAFPVTTQTYPRKQDWQLLNALAGLAQTCYRFAFDLRILQSPAFGELSEAFGQRQVGSSAMPFKRNPITAEKIDSLARYVASLPATAWHNAAHNLLERTLDDSANRRIIIPNAFLATDEVLLATTQIIQGVQVWPGAIQRNLDAYGLFAAVESVLMEAVKVGGDRQHLHEILRKHSLTAWANVAQGKTNPLADLLAAEPALTSLLPATRIRSLLDVSDYVGEAPERARTLAKMAAETIGDSQM